MANWMYNAKQDLIEYPHLKESTHNIPDQIVELDAQMTALKGSNYDKTPVQGGMSGGESRMIDYIDRKERLKINLSIVESKVKRIERGLAALQRNERRVVELMVVNRAYGNLDRLCSEIGYEKTSIYRIQEAALKKFTLAMFGVVDV